MVTCKRPDLLEVLTTFMMEIILSTPAVEIPMVIVNKRKVLISVRPNITTHSNCFRCSFQAFKRWRNIWLCSLQHYGEETCDLGVWHDENFTTNKETSKFVVMNNKWKESSDGVDENKYVWYHISFVTILYGSRQLHLRKRSLYYHVISFWVEGIILFFRFHHTFFF